MQVSRNFLAQSPEDVQRLVANYPFGLVISAGGDLPVATPLPLLLVRGQSGDSDYLLGHFARANPHVELLRSEQKALVAFMGTNGYISPSWMSDRTQAPTWNYETVHFEVEVEFDPTPEAIHYALERLVTHMEAGRPGEWRIQDMRERYHRLANAVMPFKARILATQGKFKLGQNERMDVYRDILSGLAGVGHGELAAAMKRANMGRDQSGAVLPAGRTNSLTGLKLKA